jgi:biopolymer transport protein ExbD
MGSKFGNDDDVIADINITPFVDIILVVLIIFMVTATTIVKESIKVTLPDAASGEETKSTSLGLTLLANGDLLLDGEKITASALKTRLKEAKKSEEDVVCLIAAEKNVAHGRVVWLIDLIKTEGIAKFAININKVDAIGPDPATVGEGKVDVVGG